ncbi:MAG: DUF554 domain-containing protein [Firmicutes bacterium]|nr:DUF554 domain-containing protein [Clostridiales bacterium]MBQ4339483.1 DUF554 domain-containing protein [Bacillota bacterium]
MIFTGTIVNAAAIVVCAILGTFIIKNVPERFNEIIIKAVGLSVLFVGLSGAFDNENVMLLIISMVVGSIIGEFIDIDGKMNKLGDLAEKKLGFGEGSFSKGFVTASILFCTGSMAIVGAMNSGLSLDHNMLFAKSILDGVISIVFAGTMGIGVAFSAIPILIYEGGITLIASFVGEFMTQQMITEMSAVGSLIIAGIGFNFLDIKQIKVANMIPAMFVPCVYFAFLGLI